MTDTYGSRLRQCRETSGLTQAQLANHLGLTRSSIANIEADRQRPLVDDAARAAQVLGVDPAWLAFGRMTIGQPRPKTVDRRTINRCLKELERAAETLRTLKE